MGTEPNQYSVPVALSARAALREMWPLAIFLGPVVAATAYAIYYNGWTDPGILAMYALCGVTLLMGAWGWVWSWKNRAVRYEIDGLTCIWADHRWYVPPDIYRDFVRSEVWTKFKDHAEDPRDLTRGVAVLFEGERPHARVRERDGSLGLQKVWGATYPWRRYSKVTGARRMDPGVDGYELKLQCCQTLFPEGERVWTSNG